MLINIYNFSKAEVLMKLFNAATPYKDDCQFKITLEEAEKLIDQNPELTFRNVLGKHLNIDISGNIMSGHDYDVIQRDFGLCARTLAKS